MPDPGQALQAAGGRRPSPQVRVATLAAGLTVATGLAALTTLPARAELLQSNSYIIQFSNLNLTSGTKTGTGYTVTDTVGQNAPGEYGTTGYKVYAGFQYLYGLSRFSFRILDTLITLGDNIGPYQFYEDSHQLVITTRTGGYVITARADHQLRQAGGVAAPTIPDTTCDSACTISAAAVWNSAQNVGFGFNASGTHRASDFVNGNYFRPFSDVEALESAQTIASHNSVVENDVLTVLYRVSVGGSQAAGQYQTAITYTAVPTY